MLLTQRNVTGHCRCALYTYTYVYAYAYVFYVYTRTYIYPPKRVLISPRQFLTHLLLQLSSRRQHQNTTTKDASSSYIPTSIVVVATHNEYSHKNRPTSTSTLASSGS